MSEPFRYDWVAALQRIDEAGENPASFCLYCLPIAGAQMLGALIERLHWRASFRVDDYDYSDWEFLQDIVENTEIGLMGNCDDIVQTIIDEVTTVINNSTTTIISGQDVCCYMEGGHDINEPDPDPTEQGTGSEKDELCKAAQKGHDNGSTFLEEVLSFGVAGGSISVGLIAFMIAAYALTLPLALLASLIGILTGIVLDLSSEQVLTDWSSIKKDIVCAIYSATSADQAHSNVQGVIDAADILGVSKSLFGLIYNQAQINKVWLANVGDLSTYTAAYCIDCAEGQFWYEFTSGKQGIGDNQFDWISSGYISGRCHTDQSGGSWNVHASRSGAQIQSELDLNSSPTIRYLAADIQFNTGSGSQIDQRIRFRIVGTNDTPDITTSVVQSSGQADNTWVTHQFDLGQLVPLRVSQAALYIELFRASSAANGQRILIDNLRGYQ